MKNSLKARALAATAAIGLAFVSGCSANPGPPPVVEDSDEHESTAQETASTTTATDDEPPRAEEDKSRPTISIGVDPLRAGLNPHLVANNSELVDQIAELVLPSTFHWGRMDTDVLESAAEVTAPEGVAQRVRYVIASPAQWSDGTPISGADFSYLWKKMTTTAGVKDPAGYRAISAVTTSDGGRVVTVDFAERVKDWKQLFNQLLPSHLLQNSDFDSVLANDIPASAGRFSVDSVDRSRGVITLNRNDRFWGADPAHIDVVQLREVRDSTQALNMLRSGQIGFADFTPDQTSQEALGLLGHVSDKTVTRPRQLRLHMSTEQGALEDAAARRGLASLIDTGQVARLATGRASNLKAGHNPVSGEANLTALRERASKKPIRFAVDPTSPTALAAANTLYDVLEAHGIPAEVTTDRLTTITSKLLPEGKVDAVVTWEDITLTSLSAANIFNCAEDEPLAGDLSGFCPDNAAETRMDILSGKISPSTALGRIREINAQDVLYVPLLDETRVHALGEGIVGPGQSIDDWDKGLVTAPVWRIDED